MIRSKFKKKDVFVVLCFAIVTFLGTTVCIAGKYSPKVYKAQRVLRELGYQPGMPDGRWGKKTQQAIGKFQTDKGIQITGRLDETTLNKLGINTVSKQSRKMITNNFFMEFVYIPPNSFIMGSASNEPHRSSDEKQHKVTLSEGFYMQTTEVTQGQWKSIMQRNPSFEKNGMQCPVEHVSWNDVQQFIEKLNALDPSFNYRLPTEAEWEHACRAGSDSVFNTGLCLAANLANYDGNYVTYGCGRGRYVGTTTPVKSYPPNAFGLYGMHGNVWEYCQDRYGSYPSKPVADPDGPIRGEKRVVRGGSWNDPPRYCRSACRGKTHADGSNNLTGFRLVLIPDKSIKRVVVKKNGTENGEGRIKINQRAAVNNFQNNLVVQKEIVFGKESFNMVPQTPIAGYPLIYRLPRTNLFIFSESGGWITLRNTRMELIRKMKINSGSEQQLAVCPDGKSVALINNYKDPSTGRIKIGLVEMTIDGIITGSFDLPAELPSWANFEFLSFVGNGTHLVGFSENFVIVWERSGKILYLMQDKKKSLKQVTAATDRSIIFLGYENGDLEIRGLTGKVLHQWKGHESAVKALEILPDNAGFVSGDHHGNIRVWSQNRSLQKEFLHPYRADYLKKNFGLNLYLSPDGKYLISTGSKGVLWNIREGKIAAFPDLTTCDGICFNHQSQLFIAADSRNQSVRDLSGTPVMQTRYVQSTHGRVRFHPDGRHLAIANQSNKLEIWNLVHGLQSVLSAVRSDDIDFSRDGKLLVSVSRSADRHFYSLRNGEVTKDVASRSPKRGHEHFVNISKDGSLVGVKKDIFDKTGWKYYSSIILFNAEGVEQRRFDIQKKKIRSFVMHPEGKLFFLHTLDDVASGIYNDKGDLLYPIDLGPRVHIHDAKFTMDGKSLLLKGSKDLFLIDGKGKVKHHYSTKERLTAATINRTGDLIAYAHGATILVIDRKGRPKMTLTGHLQEVSDLDFSPDSKLLASTAINGVDRIWHWRTSQSVALLNRGADWLMYTDDNFFAGSRSGGDLLRLVNGLQVYKVDQFAPALNRPDILLQRLGIDNPVMESFYLKQHERRLKNMGLLSNHQFETLSVPAIKIQDARIGGDKLVLKFDAQDKKVGLKRYNIFVNGVPLYGTKGKPIGGSSANISETVLLVDRKNEIEATVFNQNGFESMRPSLNVTHHDKQKGDLYFLGFGVSEYLSSELRLAFAAKDAADLKQLFSRAGQSSQFEAVKSLILTDAKVTRQSILDTKRFLNGARPQDAVIVFIAGHGLYDHLTYGTYYYLPYDAKIENLKQRGVTFEEFEGLLDGLKARKKVLLLDTCQSGDIASDIEDSLLASAENSGFKARAIASKIVEQKRKSSGKRGITINYRPTWLSFNRLKNRYIHNNIFRRTGAIVFSSSQGLEYSLESRLYENGLFTEMILESLQSTKSDTNEDGAVSIREMRDYVAEAVREISGGLQNPTIDRDNLHQNIVFPIISKHR